MPFPGHGEAAAILYFQRESIVIRLDEGAGTAVELVAEAALGGGEQHALVGKAGVGIDAEFETGEMADRLGTDTDFAVGSDRDRQGVGAAGAVSGSGALVSPPSSHCVLTVVPAFRTVIEYDANVHAYVHVN